MKTIKNDINKINTKRRYTLCPKHEGSMLCFGQQKCDEQSEIQSMERSPTRKTHIKHKVNKMHIKQNAMEHLSNTMQWKKTF